MARTLFDSDRLYSALDAARAARGLSWRDVAKESGVSASSLTRIGQGKRPDVDSLAALCAWSGLDARDFMELEGQQRAEPLALISTYLRGDPNLSPDAAEFIDDLVRTSYQRLRKRP
jgi:transcriptional regulator with XRE-family HTH domain